MTDRHQGRVSKGGVPAAVLVDELLHHDDRTLGALVVGLMQTEPRSENFAALGRIVRAGAREDLALVLRRGRMR